MHPSTSETLLDTVPSYLKQFIIDSAKYLLGAEHYEVVKIVQENPLIEEDLIINMLPGIRKTDLKNLFISLKKKKFLLVETMKENGFSKNINCINYKAAVMNIERILNMTKDVLKNLEESLEHPSVFKIVISPERGPVPSLKYHSNAVRVTTDASVRRNTSVAGNGIFFAPNHPLNLSRRLPPGFESCGKAEIEGACEGKRRCLFFDAPIILKTDHLLIIEFMKGTKRSFKYEYFTAAFYGLLELAQTTKKGVESIHTYRHKNDQSKLKHRKKQLISLMKNF